MDTNKIKEAVELLQSVDVLNASRVSERIDEVAAIIYSELDADPKVLTDEEVERIAYDRYLKRYYNGDREWQQRLADAMSDGLRHARDSGYLAPSAGLTVDEAEECLVEHLAQYGPDWSASARSHLRTRLIAAIEAKTNNK